MASADSYRGEARSLLRLAVPISLAQLGLVSMGLVDTAIVGRLDVDVLAGTAMGRSIALAATGLGMGVGYAMEPLAAQAVGGHQPERAYSALRTAVAVGMLVTVPCAALALLGAQLLVFAGIDAHLVSIVTAFLLGQLPGLFAFPVYVAAREFLAAHGATRPALVAAVVANLANALLGAVLVHGDDALVVLGLPRVGLPRLGALGAGLATSLASLVLAGIVLRSAAQFRPATRPPPVAATVVLHLGIPIGLQFLAEIGLFSVVGLLAGALGEADAAAHQVALALASFTFMGVYGIGAATGVMVGHAVGAGRSPRRVGGQGLLLGMGVMGAASILFASIPDLLVGLFTTDPQVVAIGTQLLRIAALFQILDGLQAVASGALRGAGDVRIPFIVHFVSHYVIGLPLAVLLGIVLGYGVQGLWWGITAGLASVATALVVRFFWLTRSGVPRVA